MSAAGPPQGTKAPLGGSAVHEVTSVGAHIPWFEGFPGERFAVNGVEIFARHGGTRGKPPLLLLHGFPQTHAIWHRVARQLAADYYLVMPDLRGYGDSSQPAGLPDHANYSKREMARDLVAVMTALGASSFYLCGHDRGVGSSRVDLQACKLEYSIVSPK